MKINDNFLVQVLNKILAYNATPILVGGCVRDHFLGIEVKDYDIEVYGLESLEKLEDLLSEFGSVNLVGKSFGIVKLSTPTMEYDFSFPRTENKTVGGHTGFEVFVDGKMDFKEASKRRDFTINSIGYDFKNKIFLDPFDGIKAIHQKILKHIDDKTFIEDPLRVYRAIQFSARFDFIVDEETLDLCKKVILKDEFSLLSKERIFEEYKKLFLKSEKPSIGLKLLNILKIEKIETEKIIQVDEVVTYSLDRKEILLVIFAILEKISQKILNDKKLLREIVSLQSFDVPKIFEDQLEENDTFVANLIKKLHMKKNMPKPLYMGKDLVQMGYKPSEKFKTILDTLYKMQLNGAIC